MNGQLVDPAVSRAKFERELAAFRKLEAMHRARGWWVMGAEFPVIEIGFITPNCTPAVLAVCARIDFTNYDLWPPSVQFIKPFDERVLTVPEVGLAFGRLLPDGTVQPIIQGHAGQPAFLCLPGVREYHNHPAHSGDSWLLHRGKGEGGLLFIVDKISRYGSESVRQFTVQVILGQVATQ